MKKGPKIKKILIAPCGMECGVCLAYLREKNKCPGCRIQDKSKRITCIRCNIKNCIESKKEKYKFCFECREFPCDKINHIDKRYKNKYHMSMIENLNNIKKTGINRFIKNEDMRWTCKKCGGTICVHKGYCIDCKANI